MRFLVSILLCVLAGVLLTGGSARGQEQGQREEEGEGNNAKSHVVELTKWNFDTHITRSKLPALVEFYASWYVQYACMQYISYIHVPFSVSSCMLMCVSAFMRFCLYPHPNQHAETHNHIHVHTYTSANK